MKEKTWTGNCEREQFWIIQELSKQLDPAPKAIATGDTQYGSRQAKRRRSWGRRARIALANGETSATNWKRQKCSNRAHSFQIQTFGLQTILLVKLKQILNPQTHPLSWWAVETGRDWFPFGKSTTSEYLSDWGCGNKSQPKPMNISWRLVNN